MDQFISKMKPINIFATNVTAKSPAGFSDVLGGYLGIEMVHNLNVLPLVCRISPMPVRFFFKGCKKWPQD